MRLVSDTIHLSATDLVNYTGCKHIAVLDMRVARGELAKPEWVDPSLQIVRRKGLEHEQAYLQYLRDKGLAIREIKEDEGFDAAIITMKDGVDVIYQAPVRSGKWNGKIDFLIRKAGASRLGNWLYEVADTKLAQETKAGTVLQLCLYSEIIGEIQGVPPENMYVVKPGKDFPEDKYRFADFEAYYKLIKAHCEQFITTPAPTDPMPSAKCDVCRWWKHCDDWWHEEDHLSLIAGIRSLHISELRNQDFDTLGSYARAKDALKEKPNKGSRETFEKLHGQAKVQLKGRETKAMCYDLLPIVPLRGLNRLPEPCDADIYFDMEGDHFHEEGGLEYLLGAAHKENGRLAYLKYWAKDRKEEKKAFEEFIDFAIQRWNGHPGMYIYHYAPYEPSALKRLAMRHATREAEVDKLLRGQRFIDLYSVIRETLQASVESYSLKHVEQFTDYARLANLRDSSTARRRISTALELNALDQLPQEDLMLVELYNKDDCYATEALHRWIENIYQEQSQKGIELSRPENHNGEGSEKAAERNEKMQELYDSLVKDLPDEPDEWNKEQKALWLLAHQIDYYWRERKCVWWEHFRVHEMETEDLMDERKALVGLKFISTLPESKKVPIHRYSYPEQETDLDPGNNLYEVQGDKIGTVYAIDAISRTIDIKKTGKTANIHPHAVHATDYIPTTVQATSLIRFANSTSENGLIGDGSYIAGRDLLLKNTPRLLNGESLFRKEGESIDDAALRIILNLDNSILPVQGPPGTGKSHLGGDLIAELVRAGKKIGVTAVSHNVIISLLEKAKEQADKKGIHIRLKHKGDQQHPFIEMLDENPAALQAVEPGTVVGGTSWLWAREEAVELLDYLFVDEAGQMSLTYVLAISRAAKNIILLGDPQQLEQPQKGAHPEGADISALEHALNGHATIPPQKGLFLGTTWRLNPAICRFTSEAFYEGRLTSKEGLDMQRTQGNSAFAGSGLFYVPVGHTGCQNKSTEEIEKIKDIADHLMGSQLTWTDREGTTKALQPDDILIVAPYNAQVNALKKALPDMRIGTVDKFQGLEAPVVIYSMTSSSAEDAPRGMSFLYNPNRLNVATSRSKCICILMAAPALLEPECNTIDQMRWANVLCRYREMARVVS
jgi:predicted RecB family nuclease